MDPLTPMQFSQTEQMIVAALLAAVSTTPVGLYYPDIDITIRWRKGHVLPTAELNRDVKRNADLTAPMLQG